MLTGSPGILTACLVCLPGEPVSILCPADAYRKPRYPYRVSRYAYRRAGIDTLSRRCLLGAPVSLPRVSVCLPGEPVSILCPSDAYRKPRYVYREPRYRYFGLVTVPIARSPASKRRQNRAWGVSPRYRIHHDPPSPEGAAEDRIAKVCCRPFRAWEGLRASFPGAYAARLYAAAPFGAEEKLGQLFCDEPFVPRCLPGASVTDTAASTQPSQRPFGMKVLGGAGSLTK
jgi:hypothetical protein